MKNRLTVVVNGGRYNFRFVRFVGKKKYSFTGKANAWKLIRESEQVPVFFKCDIANEEIFAKYKVM